MSVRHTRFEIESLAVQLFATSEARKPPSDRRSWHHEVYVNRTQFRALAVLMLDEESISLIGNDGTWRNHWTGDGRK